MQDDVCVYSVDLLNKHFVHRGIAKKHSGQKCQSLSRNYDTFLPSKYKSTIARNAEFFPKEIFTILVLLLNFLTRKEKKYWKSNKIQRPIS